MGINCLEIIGFIVGLIYLWLEYKANIYLWLASIVMPAINLKVYYDAGLYADFAIDIYYLIIAVYGFLTWKFGNVFSLRKSEVKKNVPIVHTPLRQVPLLIVALGILWLAIAYVLIHLTPSTVPVTDAFTTAASVVAMWMLARKQAEQWLVWLIVDVVTVGLYAYKGLPLYSCLYLAYSVIAFFGYRRWLRQITVDFDDKECRAPIEP